MSSRSFPASKVSASDVLGMLPEPTQVNLAGEHGHVQRLLNDIGDANRALEFIRKVKVSSFEQRKALCEKIRSYRSFTITPNKVVDRDYISMDAMAQLLEIPPIIQYLTELGY